MSEAKNTMRRALRVRRSDALIDAEEKIVGKLARLLSGRFEDAAEERLCEKLNASRVIGIYSPLLGEPDLRGIFCDWLELGDNRALALPFIDADDMMSYRQWDPNADGNICRDAKGIISSTGHGVSPDFLVIPCVGYSDSCHRLGNGGGFFDRYIARMRREEQNGRVAFLCGVALEACCVQPELFESWDEPLDCILTEEKVRFHNAMIEI